MNARPRRHPETAYREIGDEGGLVVLPRRSEVKVLNPVGTLVFGLLDGEHTLDEIVRRVVDEFEIGTDQARQDVEEFLSDLDKHGMLASAESAEAAS